jgi:hypothetical protein
VIDIGREGNSRGDSWGSIPVNRGEFVVLHVMNEPNIEAIRRNRIEFKLEMAMG